MADISKCVGNDCPKKKNCYRFTVESDEYIQSYFTVPPIKENGECDYYWPNKPEKNDRNSIQKTP